MESAACDPCVEDRAMHRLMFDQAWPGIVVGEGIFAALSLQGITEEAHQGLILRVNANRSIDGGGAAKALK
jgi:hypothetical protein